MLDPAIAERLSRRGHDVEAVAERPDLRTQPDSVILAAAEDEDRVIVTQDLGDFRVLAAAEARSGRPHPALILISGRSWPRANRRTLGRLVNALDDLLTSGAAVEGERWLASRRTEPLRGAAISGARAARRCYDVTAARALAASHETARIASRRPRWPAGESR